MAAETEEQRAAKLAELRRLTPEQEAAAAKAAQRIEEVAAAAEAAPEEERAAATGYKGKEMWDIYGGGAIEPLLEHTPLIDLEYLVALAEGGGVMPCGRQNVPPAAFITKRNLWRLKLWNKARNKGSLGVLVLSYPWLDWFHPDRLGAQLHRLLPFLKAMLAEAKRDSPHCTVGVMIDFLCLPQKPFATEEDGARFGVSLKAINAWYFHQFTYTLLVTNPPPEGADYSNTRLHRDRGWCFFERSSAQLCTPTKAGGYAWPMVVDVGAGLDGGGATRAPPLLPADFAAQVKRRKFTNGADCELVIGLYKKTLESVLGKAPNLKMIGNTHWGDAEMRELVEVLPLCAEATLLDIQVSFHEVTAEGVGVLTRCVDEGKLPAKLKKIVYPNAWKDISSFAELRAVCERRGIELV